MNAYQKITDAILACLENPGQWQRPWVGNLSMPSNGVSGRTYRGSNVVSLWLAAQASCYSQSRWATFKQWSSVSKTIRKGEHGTPIVFFSMLERRESEQPKVADATARKVPLARLSYVFNIEQTEGYEAPATGGLVRVANIVAADELIKATGAVIKHGGTVACYRRKADEIQMPELAAFVDTATSTATDGYYATVFHELTHWTASRVARELGRRFGDEAYAAEELVAELGAAFLCAELGITSEPRQDHADYIASWISLLRHDPRAFSTAATKAAQATDYLLAFRSEQKAAA